MVTDIRPNVGFAKWIVTCAVCGTEEEIIVPEYAMSNEVDEKFAEKGWSKRPFHKCPICKNS